MSANRSTQQSSAPQTKVLPQTKETQLKSYQKRLKDDIKSMVDNYMSIVQLGKVGDDAQITRSSQAEQDNYEMQVRAANVVRAAESLLKLVADIKQFLILNDFPHVNEAISQQNQTCRGLQSKIDNQLLTLRDDIANELFELEEEYYSSNYK